MNFEMPLVPDMEAQKTRKIVADFPNDTTQEEFWQFVALAGTALFGYPKFDENPDGLEGKSEWDIVGSFQEWGFEGEIKGDSDE
jgi:hypothetical protein